MSTDSNSKRPLEDIKYVNNENVVENSNHIQDSEYKLIWKNLDISVKKTGKKIVNGLTGCFESGQLISIIGASGCGKTTLLNCLAGYTRDDLAVDGDLFINNSKLTNLKAHKKVSGYVLQQDILLGDLTVYETLMYQAQFKLPNNSDYKSAVDNVIS